MSLVKALNAWSLRLAPITARPVTFVVYAGFFGSAAIAMDSPLARAASVIMTIFCAWFAGYAKCNAEVKAVLEGTEQDWKLAFPHFTCPSCGRTTFNASDVKFRFCSSCCRFADDGGP